MDQRPLNLFISVGEESADHHGAHVVEALRQMQPDIKWFGFGGKALKQQGVDILYPLPDLALIGFVEVIKRLPTLFHVRAIAEKSWDERKPDAVILIDYPGFHLHLAKRAQERGIPVFYYIAPQAWAWREKRVETMRETIKRLFVIFPFEEHFFQSRGVDAQFVGHPLLDRIPPTPAQDRAPLERPVVGLLPGSRKNELKRLLPTLLSAAKRLRKQKPETQFFLPLAETLPESFLQNFDLPDWLEVGRDPDYARRKQLTFAWTASGTATMENALLGLPMAVVYRSGAVNAFLARRLIRVPYIGMVNLIAQKGICPEFIQEQCHPEQLARHAEEFLSDAQRYQEMIDDLNALRQKLGGENAAQRAAQAIHAAILETL
ncbi:MAG: lipid-A-disaccharide synthase [Candidatus Hinthialibacter antarcticus]|nr:lipid-A-disaccharide synthase [Candidatus Hinthialibacter antarcticus]